MKISIFSNVGLEVGEIREDGQVIKEEIISYFTSLYAPSNFARSFLEGLAWDPISERERERRVGGPISFEKVHKVVFSFDRIKSSGQMIF